MMTIAQLVETLQTLPQDAIVVLSSDPEGNSYETLQEIGMGAYVTNQYHNELKSIGPLTPKLKKMRFEEEDVAYPGEDDSYLAVCFWP